MQHSSNLQTRLKIQILVGRIVTEYFLSSHFSDIGDLDRPNLQ